MEIKGDSMMKKIIAVLLTLAMIPLGICTVSATEDNSSFHMSYSDFQKNYIVTAGTKVYNNFILMKNSASNRIDAKIILTKVGKEHGSDFDPYIFTKPTHVALSDGSYVETISTPWGDVTASETREFKGDSGTYYSAKIKMSEFDNSFNDDGTYTKSILGNTHDYNFTQENSKYASMIVFRSGRAYTVATPDENGFYEVYLSYNMGDTLEYTAIFSMTDDYGNIFTSVKESDSLNKLMTFGDANRDAKVDITDATLIQKYLVGSADLDGIQVRNANVLLDSYLNITDVTTIQKHLVQ